MIESEVINSAHVKRGGRLQKLVSELLQQGLSSRQLALAFAVGATIGVLPTVWGTSLLCMVVACCFGLNQVVVQIANYLVYPMQIVLFIPFFKLGGVIFSARNIPENLGELSVMMQSVPLEMTHKLWQANLQAAVIWLISSPLLMTMSYSISLLLVKNFQRDSLCSPVRIDIQ